MDSYDIHIEYDTFHLLPDYILRVTPSCEKYVLIIDENLFQFYGDKIINSFKEKKIDLLYYTVEPGEHSKSREEKSKIEDFMFDNNCHIDTVLIAFGGGVIGDLVGFIASTYMRGINYIQIPTSFLSMVDSSIGAKTSINVDKYGKNLLGSFYRPKAVLIDIKFLETLSQRDLSNGMAEAIKIALINDENLFNFIETNISRILEKNVQILKKVIYECVKLKANIVKQDEKETSGLRSILNFGHSIGHGIEILSNGKLLHGECVSIGMILETELARNKNFLLNSNVVISRLNNLLKSFRLPTTIPSNISFNQIIQKMSIDKKNKNGKKQIVILTNIGSVKTMPHYTTPIDDQDLINLLDTNVILIKDNIINDGNIVDVPGSKSISNRVLLLSALGIGQCRIHGLLYSIDTQTMLICLKQLGVNYYWDQNETLIIHGTNGKLNLTGSSTTLYLNNSGTSSRFLTTLCTILPSNTEIILTGDQRLKERPIKDLADTLIENENNIEYLNVDGCLPIKIRSNGQFKGGEMMINGDISSQYITSLLLISPFASTPIRLKLNEEKPIVSKSYIDMTIQLMKNQFGIDIDDSQLFSYHIHNSGSYQNPIDIQIEGDASSSSYFLGMAAVHPGLTVTISNIGQNSLQGDSQFCKVLELMGCHVIQTETTTTLTGPQELRAIPHEIDMNSMTDTFMTLAAVAVFAHGTTQITNIANQRLKECNRIKAMVDELNKCGINAMETDTGLNIQGNSNQDITQSALIHCYDDHRIAMSFSIVASRGKNIIISDKRCVDKTYPEFWLHLEKVFHLKVLSPTLISSNTLSNIQNKVENCQEGCSSKRIFLIGMPYSGKSTLGRYIAKQLNYFFIDIDDQISNEIPESSIKEYINQNGIQMFRSLELKVFKQVLEKLSLLNDNVIISCGGGCIESIQIRDQLSEQPYVIYINRHINDIKQESLTCELAIRPYMDLETKLQERQIYYRQCSKYEFCLLKNDQDWKTIEINLLRFIKTITEKKTTLPVSEDSFFVCLTYKDLLDVPEDQFTSVIQGSEAIELRVDMFKSSDVDFIGQQISYIRKYTSLPIIYTVRSQANYGTFQNNELEIFELLNYGIRFGCEFIDMESNWSNNIKKDWLNTIKNKHPYIIASLHLKFSLFDFNQVVHQCNNNGQVDVVKIVLDIDNHLSVIEDILPIFTRLKQFFNQSENSVKVILVAMGEQGKLTRVLNRFLTPVTHQLLPQPAVKAQMTVKEIQEARQMLGIINLKQYYLFGTPIQQSLSPSIHQTGFDYFYLPYQYQLCQTNDISLVQNIIKEKNFGGASVTIPFKQDLYTLLISDKNNTITESAKKIGAINTISKLENGQFHGENTDWMAIYKLINEKMTNRGSALIVGTGGTARAALYALTQIKHIDLINLYNPRNLEKAIQLASTYNNPKILPVTGDDVNEMKNICVVINTLPSSVNFTLDHQFFENNSSLENSSILFEVNYIPYQTSLIKQAQQYKWNIIYGIDMLIEQGLQQFQIWTGKANAVTQIIKQTVYKTFNKTIDQNK